MILPKTKLGKWSVVLIALAPVLFNLGMILSQTVYSGTEAGDTIWQDFINRPLIFIIMISGFISGILAFILGISAILKQKERTILVYVSTLFGSLLIFFLFAEIIFPH